jgi:lambda repressor-like predicted transcriptional regulator
MNTATVKPSDMTSATSLLVENVRIYLQVKSAFEQCDDEIKAVIVDMTDIIEDEEATLEEKQRALYTIVEAIFPSLGTDFLASCERVRKSSPARSNGEEMACEEASFAEAVSALLRQKGVTQDELGRRIGVSQPAIANLLNRNCRPQRKTVAKIADALNVSPQSLWPGIKLD